MQHQDKTDKRQDLWEREREREREGEGDGDGRVVESQSITSSPVWNDTEVSKGREGRGGEGRDQKIYRELTSHLNIQARPRTKDQGSTINDQRSTINEQGGAGPEHDLNRRLVLKATSGKRWTSAFTKLPLYLCSSAADPWVGGKRRAT